jgi:hypothetical protein
MILRACENKGAMGGTRENWMIATDCGMCCADRLLETLGPMGD